MVEYFKRDLLNPGNHVVCMVLWFDIRVLTVLLHFSDGIFPPPNIKTQLLSSLLPELSTGDIVLFSGATSSGAIIKFFDHSEFSHCGIVR